MTVDNLSLDLKRYDFELNETHYNNVSTYHLYDLKTNKTVHFSTSPIEVKNITDISIEYRNKYDIDTNHVNYKTYKRKKQMKYKTNLIHVKGCHDCPFHNNEWCNLGAGNVVNEWRAETYGAKCPLTNFDRIAVSNTYENLIKPDYDIVEKPEHYANGNVECWDAFCSAAPIEQQIGAFRFNVFKYLWRLGKKDGHTALEDAQKAERYLSKLIEMLKQT